MSLKSFHLFFIIVSILFALGFGAWLLTEQPIESESLNIFAAVLSFSAGGGLFLYAIRFIRKARDLSEEGKNK